MRTVSFLLCLVALACLAWGCSSNTASKHQQLQLPDSRAVVPPLSELPRQAAADSDEFLIQQTGASFASDLPFSSCAVQGGNALFTPAWSGADNQLSDAAFALYRLTFDPAQPPVVLTLDWAVAPAPADCWIGLSNWSRNAWEWRSGAEGWALALPAADQFTNGGECYVVVMVLGQTACSLAKLGFGEPEPPPPPLSGAGYTLIAPLNSKDTFLVDMDGSVVHTWTANYTPGASAMLLEDGHLLRAANINNPNFGGGGFGGRIVEFDWDNNVVWYFELSTATQVLHHDFTRLPNGNILAIVMTNVPPADMIEAGRNPGTLDDYFWADSIIEIEPVLPNGGNIVWEWHALDHLVQDFDSDKGQFADPAAHPELIDVNFPDKLAGDWTHVNCVAYNPEFDQVILSVPMFGEIWVIDHSTTTAEAAGHSGGTYGKGGDLLYRWGNPLAYRRGGSADQRLFFNHDSHWIADGLPGAGDILIFNNQLREDQGLPTFSAIEQITPPQNPDGSYNLPGASYGPDSYAWEFFGNPKQSFFSPIMSSAQRLRDGNTLICTGASGRIFEVEPDGNITWEYDAESTFRALRYTYDYPGVAALQQEP